MTDNFILDIMQKFNSSSIVDLEISRNGSKIALKKADACVASLNNNTVSKTVDSENTSAKNDVKIVESASKDVTVDEKNDASEKKTSSSGEKLKSPIVGTFYRSPSPDSPAYAEVGKKISKGEPLCILEAMKMMNTMNADFDMEILEVLVQNGELVEYDQPLFVVKKL